MSSEATSSKRKRSSDVDGDAPDNEDKDATIARLRKETATLKESLSALRNALGRETDDSTTYFASSHANMSRSDLRKIPEHGMTARHIKEMIDQVHLCDFKPRLNTSSYVNVVSEQEERDVCLLGAEINLADASVYPATVELHDTVVNMIADMWHAPPPKNEDGNYSGAGTVGSTEACLLAGLALKFRWRKWYAERNNMSEAEVQAVRPNLVISTCYQAAWEKFFRYFDVDAKFSKPNLLKSHMAVDPKDLVSLVDDKTIGVVCILGNHYNGVYDPVWDVDVELKKLNKEKGYQVGIHVDAASGGFIAPFQSMGPDGPPPFDFRLDSVLTMSSSGHKFGESVCGTGWVVFRQREDLAEHIAVSVTYLGGHCDSITLNFSRPASGPYVQFYKLMRLGREGYKAKVENQMNVASYLRSFIRDLKHPSGKPRFELLDGGDTCCLPVVAARLNPDLNLKYDDIDLQHALSESHWYVSGYSLGFENFDKNGEMDSLFTDVGAETTMFRIVCKSNLSKSLAEDLVRNITDVLGILDTMGDGYHSMTAARAAIESEADEYATMTGETKNASALAVLAAGKWIRLAKKHGRKMETRKRARRGSMIHTVC